MLLSFVLVAHRDQAQLEACAASLLAGAPDDVELVAVDDASPDHGPEILAALAARDAFTWSVQPSDRLAPGALAAVLERLRADPPDVLLVDHVRIDALGRRRRGPHGGLLRAIAADGATTLERRPGLAATAPRVWDKVVRRGRLDTLAAGAWPALLGAERIGAAPDARYERHVLPRDVTQPDPDPQALLAWVEAHPELPAARRAVVLAALLGTLARLGGREQAAAFARLGPLLRAQPGLEARLVRRGDLRAYRALQEARAQRRALGRRRRT